MRFFLKFISFAISITYLSVPVFADNIKLQKQMEQIENRYQKKIGVAAINLGNQQSIEYRAREFFPIQSTFKTVLVAYILKQNMSQPGVLKQRLTIHKEDLVVWSPVTEKNRGKQMSIEELCQASISYSDNTATNLLLKYSGGPDALNQFLRSTGDQFFHLHGWEPALNSNPEKTEDSSTPAAMENFLVTLLKTDLLGPVEKYKLLSWMKNNTTGDQRIRSAIPEGWLVADKTGAGSYGIANDIAIIWPPHCEPIVLAIYTHGQKKQEKTNDRIFTEITHKVIETFASHDACITLNKAS